MGNDDLILAFKALNNAMTEITNAMGRLRAIVASQQIATVMSRIQGMPFDRQLAEVTDLVRETPSALHDERVTAWIARNHAAIMNART